MILTALMPIIKLQRIMMISSFRAILSLICSFWAKEGLKKKYFVKMEKARSVFSPLKWHNARIRLSILMHCINDISPCTKYNKV